MSKHLDFLPFATLQKSELEETILFDWLTM
jgi:hypothetical protein